MSKMRKLSVRSVEPNGVQKQIINVEFEPTTSKRLVLVVDDIEYLLTPSKARIINPEIKGS